MAPEVVVADASTWTAVLVAALGSSALGAIFGGYLTTRMRGRIEREEAWRSRLFEAADDFVRALGSALRTLGGLLPDASRGERRLRKENGELTEEADRVSSSLSELLDDVELRLAHVELLVGEDSPLYEPGVRAMQLLQHSVNLVRGRSTAARLVEAAVAERQAPGVGLEQIADSPRLVASLEILVRSPELPVTFEPSDDANVARWARALHNAAGDSAHRFMRAARDYIEGYRSPR